MNRAIYRIRALYDRVNSAFESAVLVYRRLLLHHWHQAKDVDGPDWPPLWLARLFLLSILLFLLSTVIRVLSRISSALIEVFGATLGASPIISVTLGSIHRYFDATGSTLSVPGQQLWLLWAGCGVFFLVFSMSGYLGARLGWLIFGVASIAFTYLDPIHQGWQLRAAVLAFLWGLLTTLAFVTSLKLSFDWRRLGNLLRLTELSRKNPVETAEASSIALGFSGLSEYFDERGNQTRRDIANDLKVADGVAKSLRAKYVSSTVKPGSKASPRIRREAIREATAPNADVGAIAKRLGVATGTIRSWVEKERLDANNDETEGD